MSLLRSESWKMQRPSPVVASSGQRHWSTGLIYLHDPMTHPTFRWRVAVKPLEKENALSDHASLEKASDCEVRL